MFIVFARNVSLQALNSCKFIYGPYFKVQVNETFIECTEWTT
jgi:hypothetical protein